MEKAVKKRDKSSFNKEYNFQYGLYKDIKVKGKPLPFAKLHMCNQKWKIYLVVVACSFISAIVITFLIKNSGLYTFGLSAALQGVSKIIYTSMNQAGIDSSISDLVYNILYWGLYCVVNIPLLVFAYFKISKDFAKMTSAYLLISTITGVVIGLIPGVSDVFIFGDTSLSVSGISDPLSGLIDNNVLIIPFWAPDGLLGKDWVFNSDNYIKIFFLFVYSSLYAIFTGFLYALIYTVGCSTAGMDIVSVYFATKKQINVTKLVLLFNLMCVFCGTLIGSYGSACIIDKSFTSFQFILSANFVFTLYAMTVSSLIFNKMFPKSKQCEVRIISEKVSEINDYLTSIKYTQRTSLYEITGGYTKEKKVVLSTICMRIEAGLLIRHISTIDPNAIIIVSDVISFDGRMNIQQQRYK